MNDLLSTPAPPWFLELYRRHFSSVYRSASLFGVEDDELEDAAQEVFFIAYRRQEEFDAALGSERAWLLGISRRIAWRLRRGRARHERKLAALTRVAPSDGAPELDRVLDAQRARATLERFLASLEPDKREAFILGEIEGLNRRDLGAALGVNPNTAYSRLQAARRLFQRAFPEDAAARRMARTDAEAVARSERQVWLGLAPLWGGGAVTKGAGAGGVTSAWARVWTSSALARHVIVFTATFVLGAAGIAAVRPPQQDSDRTPRPAAAASRRAAPPPPASTPAEPPPAPAPIAAESAPPATTKARVAAAKAERRAPPSIDPLRTELALLRAARDEIAAGQFARALARLDAPQDQVLELADERALLRLIARCNLNPGGLDASERARLKSMSVSPALAEALRACDG